MVHITGGNLGEFNKGLFAKVYEIKGNPQDMYRALCVVCEGTRGGRGNTACREYRKERTSGQKMCQRERRYVSVPNCPAQTGAWSF